MIALIGAKPVPPATKAIGLSESSLRPRSGAADFADLSGYQVYAYGGPAMIDAARTVFTTTRALPEDSLFADSFTYAAVSEPAP